MPSRLDNGDNYDNNDDGDGYADNDTHLNMTNEQKKNRRRGQNELSCLSTCRTWNLS